MAFVIGSAGPWPKESKLYTTPAPKCHPPNSTHTATQKQKKATKKQPARADLRAFIWTLPFGGAIKFDDRRVNHQHPVCAVYVRILLHKFGLKRSKCSF